jgi:hypothetical protein
MLKSHYTFNYDDVFEEIPGDRENVIFCIPEEISRELTDNQIIEGWFEGSKVVLQITERVYG